MPKLDFDFPEDDEIVDTEDGTEDTKEAVADDEFTSFLNMIKGDGDDSFEQPKDFAPTETDEDEDDEEDQDDDEDENDEEDDESEDDADEEEDDEEESSEVDFDTVITLPNGKTLTIEALSNGYRDGSELDEQRKAFESSKLEFETSSSTLADKLDLAKLEADRVLDDFRDFDWQALAVEDPKEFANTKLFVEKYARRSKDIREAQTAIRDQAESERVSAQEAKAASAVAQLEKDIPDWNRELYSKVMTHAIELGMSENDALQLMDVGVIKALVNSLNVTEGKRTVKAKITRKRQASDKVIKSGPKKVTKKAPTKTSFTNESDEFDFFRSILK